MHTEYEVRVLEVNKEEIIKKLELLNAKKVGDWNQKRYVYDLKPKKEGEWIRLRTNGEIATLTYKNVYSNTIDGTKETEIIVSDFENTNQLLNNIGFIPRSYQENKRIQYILDDVEIDIDTWPMIPDYLEIEGNSVEKVEKMLKKLELDKCQITTLSPQDVYIETYGIDINNIKELKF